MRRIHVPDKVPFFSTPDELFDYVGEYMKAHPELSDVDASGNPYVDVAVRYNREVGQYEFGGFVLNPAYSSSLPY